MYYALTVSILYYFSALVGPCLCSEDYLSPPHALPAGAGAGAGAGAMDYLSKFLDRVQAAADEAKTTQRGQEDYDEKPMKFTDFLQKAIVIVNQLDDQDLESFLNVLDEESRKYHYKGCKFYELMESPLLRRYITDAFNDLQYTPLDYMRKTLAKVQTKLASGDLTPTQKHTANLINFLYDKRHTDKMKDTLQSLSSYQQDSKSYPKQAIASIIRDRLRTLVFDHYSAIPDVGRSYLKQQVHKFFQTNTPTKTPKAFEGTEDDTDKELQNKTAKTKKHKHSHDMKHDAATDKSEEHTKKHVARDESEENNSEHSPEKNNKKLDAATNKSGENNKKYSLDEDDKQNHAYSDKSIENNDKYFLDKNVKKHLASDKSAENHNRDDNESKSDAEIYEKREKTVTSDKLGEAIAIMLNGKSTPKESKDEKLVETSDKSGETKNIMVRGKKKNTAVKNIAENTEKQKEEVEDDAEKKNNEKEKEEQPENAENGKEVPEREKKEEKVKKAIEREETEEEGEKITERKDKKKKGKKETSEREEKVKKAIEREGKETKGKEITERKDKKEKGKKETSYVPHHFLSLFPEEKKTKSTTPRTSPRIGRHKKHKVEKEKKAESSSSEQKVEVVKWTKMMFSDNDKDNKEKKHTKKKEKIWSLSFSREKDTEITEEPKTTKKTSKKVAIQRKPSKVPSSPLWSYFTKDDVKSAQEKHDTFFEISLSSSTERKTKKAKTTEHPNENQSEPLRTGGEGQNLLRQIISETAQKVPEVSAQLIDVFQKQYNESKDTKSGNFLWDIGVSLFKAAFGTKSDAGKTTTASTATSATTTKEHLRDHPPASDMDKESFDELSDLSGNNKLWVSTSKKTPKDGILRHKHALKIKNNSKKTSTEGEDVISHKKLHGRDRAGLFERAGFIQSLVKASPSSRSRRPRRRTTTRLTHHQNTTGVTQDQRRLYWASAPLIQQGVKPRSSRSFEESDTSGSSYYSEDGWQDRAARQFEEDRGLSIEAYPPDYRRQQSPKGEQNHTRNLTLVNVETVLKKTIEVSHDPQLKEQLLNIEQLVKNLKDKYDNKTLSATSRRIPSRRLRASLNRIALDKSKDKDSEDNTESTSAESSVQDEGEFQYRKYGSEDTTTVVPKTTATRHHERVYTTSTTVTSQSPANVVPTSDELLQIPTVVKNQTKAGVLQPDIRLSSNEISNFIPNDNAMDGHS